MVLLIPGLVFLAILLIFVGVTFPLFASDPVHSRLAQFTDRPRTLEEIELQAPFS
jgi:hypothetical protein